MPPDRLPDLLLMGSRIRAIREAQGLSQEELASRSGVSQSSISLVESNRRLPSVENLAKIALCLRVTTDSLIGMPDDVRDNVFFRHAGEISAEDTRLALDILGVIRKREKG